MPKTIHIATPGTSSNGISIQIIATGHPKKWRVHVRYDGETHCSVVLDHSNFTQDELDIIETLMKAVLNKSNPLMGFDD